MIPRTHGPWTFDGDSTATLAPMGIRYFAHPISPREVAALRADPDRCLCCTPLTDLANGAGSQDDTLDLDKAWREMQFMFAREPFTPRPAAQLVHGDARYTGLGYESYRGVLDAEQVTAIAKDLTQFVADELSDDQPSDPRAADSYVRRYTERARDFTTAVAAAGSGMIYRIG